MSGNWWSSSFRPGAARRKSSVVSGNNYLGLAG
jgi:hypothetical protein